jgi:hypothetical protein
MHSDNMLNDYNKNYLGKSIGGYVGFEVICLFLISEIVLLQVHLETGIFLSASLEYSGLPGWMLLYQSIKSYRDDEVYIRLVTIFLIRFLRLVENLGSVFLVPKFSFFNIGFTEQIAELKG